MARRKSSLHDWMVAEGWTDTALAARVGVTRQAVAHWRRGEREPRERHADALRDISGDTVMLPRRRE